MTLDYRNIFPTSQSPTNEHKYLDELLQSNMHIQDLYPQLFQNQDSLFVPDDVHGLHEVKAHLQRCREQQRNRRDSNSFKNKSSQKQMLQEYLDLLEENQFTNMQGQNKRNYNIHRQRKTLQSSLECTFKPQILKKSSQIAVNLQPSFQRLTMQVRTSTKKLPYKPSGQQIQRHYSKQRIEKLSKPRVLKTQPSENIQSIKIQTQKRYTIPRSSNYLDVAARNQLWEQQKQIKIERLRKQEEQNKLKKETSTFVPKITDYKGQKSANLSSFGKQGIANYFQRLNMAKSKNNSYSGKQNSNSFRKQSMSPYCTNNSSITPKKQKKVNENKKNVQKVKYDEAVKQLHKKLMSLNI